MAESPPTPLVLEARSYLLNFDDRDLERASHIESEVPGINTAVCRVCDLIVRGFSAPLRELYSAELGTVQDVMSGPCNEHTDLITWFIGYWEDEGFADHSLDIIKHPGDSHLQLLRDGVIYPPFELLDNIPLDSSYFTTPRDEGSTTHTVNEQSSIFGRAKALDEHWICLDMVKDWYRMCTDNHGEACNSPSFVRHLDARPAILIDTQDYCLVPGNSGDGYLALSYVWGHVDSLKLKKDNAEILHLPGILRDKDTVERIPTTVLHAIEFTRVLRERYLWVDSLCIVQDEEDDRKQEQLNNMTAIYANASMTIIAADGSHAEYGLRGIREVSRAVKRTLHQEFVPFGPHRSVVERVFTPKNEASGKAPVNVYYQRAWTFQEYLFSKRRVVFQRDSILWECCSTTWFEDVRCCDGEDLPRPASLARRQGMFATALPRLYDLTDLVKEFNKTQLTYEGDCLAAFAGMASALSLSFDGDFLCGLPEMFFDVALLWQPVGELRRRLNSLESGSSVHSPCLPSWSWAGWAGDIDLWSWQSGCDFVKRGTTGAMTTRETFPITKWQVIEPTSSTDPHMNQREISGMWYDFKERYRDLNHPLPEGWTRHISHGTPLGHIFWTYPDCPPPEGFGSRFYTHISCPLQQFWYPIPLRQPGARPTIRNPVALLRSTVETAIFYSRGIYLHFHTPSVSIEDNYGRWAGVLRPHRRSDLSEDVRPKMQPLELVAISQGIARNLQLEEPALEEWNLDERPKDGRLYEFYNVLWILRSGGYSYRRGIGRVRKDIWEQQRRKNGQLILA